MKLELIVIEKKVRRNHFFARIMSRSQIAFILILINYYIQVDILHEAGHLAVTLQLLKEIELERKKCQQNGQLRAMKLARFYGRMRLFTHLKLPLEFVFHPNGYKNNSEWFISNFNDENYIGLPFLEWAGITLSENRAAIEEEKAFSCNAKMVRD